jgi:hypothetical protein
MRVIQAVNRDFLFLYLLHNYCALHLVFYDLLLRKRLQPSVGRRLLTG